MSVTLLKRYIELVLERKHSRGRGERRKKPGGPRTDAGAVRQLNPDAFNTRVRSIVKSQGGDVEDAAQQLGVAKRTLYHYLEDEPELHNVKTTADFDQEKEEKEDKKREA